MSRIFISYRREDTLVYADRLQEELAEHFGPDEVFRDLDTIAPGIDFVTAIDGALDQAEIMLVLIGPEWLAPDARRRLHDPGDYVRVEIAAGLGKPTVRVIPVLVGGAHMPKGRDLPEDVSPLTRRNAFEMIDTRWRADRAELVRQLDRVLSGEGDGRKSVRRMVALRLRRVPVALWAVAGVLALAVAVLLLVVLMRNPSPSDREVTPPPDGGTPTERTGTETPSAPGALAWSIPQEVDLGEAGEQRMNAIVNPLKGNVPAFVAVGFETLADERDAVVWSSANGKSWTREDAQLGVGGDQVMTSVSYVSKSELLYAGGMNDSEGDADAALWVSRDGAQWDPIEGFRVPGSSEAINGVTSTSLGVVGAGSLTAAGSGGEDGAIWVYQPDEGVSLVRPRAMAGAGAQRINRVAQVDDGVFVAVGLNDDEAGAWFSDDNGRNWVPVNSPSLSGPGTQEILDVAVVRETGLVVAVGRDGENGAVWFSPTGQAWSRVGDLDEAFTAASGTVVVSRVFPAEERARASGAPVLIAGGQADGEAAVWTSDDGEQWERDPESEGGLGGTEGAIRGLTAKRLPAVAVGWSGSGESSDAAVWLGGRPSREER